MHETPAEFEASQRSASPTAAPGDEDLSRYRYHTGATPTRLARDEACPVLFRDLGTAATARFLRGDLRRLAGPHTPLLYLRVAEWREPYDDHEQIGRLVFLRPLALAPWRAGVPGVFVARASRPGDCALVGYVPGGHDLAHVAREAAAMRSLAELREALGGRAYDDAREAARERVEAVERDLAHTDRAAAPLRAALQSGDRALRARAGALMARARLTEEDVCAAWHHLSRARRAAVRAALDEVLPEARALREALR